MKERGQQFVDEELEFHLATLSREVCKIAQSTTKDLLLTPTFESLRIIGSVFLKPT